MVLGFLGAGLGALALGVNLMATRYGLLVTNENVVEVKKKLVTQNGMIIILGFVILVLGVLSSIWKNYEQSTIITTGSGVALMGFLGVIRAIGHRYEKVVFGGAWASTIVGVIFIIAAIILAS